VLRMPGCVAATILCMAAKQGPNVLFCVANGTQCIGLACCAGLAVWQQRSYWWLPNRDQMSYSAWQMGPNVEVWRAVQVDCVRVVKIPGAGIADSSVVQGMVLKRGAEGTVTAVADAKVVVYAQGVDTASTETKVPNRDQTSYSASQIGRSVSYARVPSPEPSNTL
jgi:hypothetical protein